MVAFYNVWAPVSSPPRAVLAAILLASMVPARSAISRLGDMDGIPAVVVKPGEPAAAAMVLPS